MTDDRCSSELVNRAREILLGNEIPIDHGIVPTHIITWIKEITGGKVVQWKVCCIEEYENSISFLTLSNVYMIMNKEFIEKIELIKEI